MIGAVTGSFFSEIFKEKALLVCCIILLSVFVIMFKDYENKDLWYKKVINNMLHTYGL